MTTSTETIKGNCCACSIPLEQGKEPYFAVSQFQIGTDKVSERVLTCALCLEVFYGKVVPDLVNIYKGDSSCPVVKSSTKINQTSAFSRLKRWLKLAG